VALAAATAQTRLVAPNEGWFADPAIHLATQGFFGTTILDSSGTWLEGLDRHTYWILPLHPLALAAVYRVFRGVLLMELGRSAEAKADAEAALLADPAYAPAKHLLANLSGV